MKEARQISGGTIYCAVLGHPVKHTASPAMHNAALRQLGLDWRYLAFDVRPDLLREALLGAKAMKFAGLNLTVPHKILAMEMMDALDESAREWGAVNTVLFEGQSSEGNWRPVWKPPLWKPLWQCDPAAVTSIRMRGFNTDADAIARSIEEDLGIRLQGASVLLLGAGGAGRTAALKLAAAGVKSLSLVNRTASKAEAVAKEIQARGFQAETRTGYPGGKVDLVVNATSLGLKSDDPLPFSASEFSLKQAGFAYDMIYRPAVTPFLAEAEAAGCKTANGLGMLLYQGARALEIWTGQPAPVELMRRALHEHIYPEANLNPAGAA